MFKKFLTLVQKYRVAILYHSYRKMAQQKANDLHCRIYCVKVNGHPRLISRNDLKYLRSTKQVPKSFTSLDLQRIALFWVNPKQNR